MYSVDDIGGVEEEGARVANGDILEVDLVQTSPENIPQKMQTTTFKANASQKFINKTGKSRK